MFNYNDKTRLSGAFSKALIKCCDESDTCTCEDRDDYSSICIVRFLYPSPSTRNNTLLFLSAPRDAMEVNYIDAYRS